MNPLGQGEKSHEIWYFDLDSHLEEGGVKKGVEDNTLCSSI